MGKHKEVLEKICDWNSLAQKVQNWQEQGDKVVFTNGCFDLLHKGHVDYLARAADLGNRLVVGLNTDASVSAIKGPSRPIQDENSRMQILASLGFVDAVTLFGEDTPYDLIACVKPDILVKGSDYQPENIVGFDIVTARGGKVMTLDFVPGYSTSAIEKKIKSS